MRHIAKTWLILMLVLALFVPQAAFASGTVRTVKLNQVQQRNTELTMYVSMSDASGYPCTGNYTADQFTIMVDGKTLQVESVERFDSNTTGIHYVFSVDVSGSVSHAMMESVRDAMHGFVDTLGPHDTMSIITFGENVNVLVQNTSDKEILHQIIDGIQPNEKMTALYKGVIDAVVLAEVTGGRSAVIVITDGKNDPTKEMESYTKESIYEQVNRAQVPLYCIGLDDNDGVDTESLYELATVTGGNQFVINADYIGESLGYVSDTMKSAIVLKATLINYNNREGFAEASTFMVGFQPADDPFVTSNELQQNINWSNIPGIEAYTLPEISLVLDDVEVMYSEGEIVTITGAVEIEQGDVEADDLELYVNGEPWRLTEIKRNGNNYTFIAEGVIPADATRLEVRAEIAGTEIASRIQRMTVVQPTLAPTATPAPVLTVELDDSGRDIMFEAGKNLNISGVINVQGVIIPENLLLYVNDESCPMNIVQINSSQYEFTAECVMPDTCPDELNIQVQLNGTEIYSRAQRLFLVTPSPTPDPELYFSLSDVSVESKDGEPVVIRGNIEILSGEVSPDDLGLYVNNVKWDMELEILSDGTYGFTASNVLADGNISQLDIKVRLQSNTKVVSNSEKLIVTTPVPTPTASPTPRPVVTPPPIMNTDEPAADNEGINAGASNVSESAADDENEDATANGNGRLGFGVLGGFGSNNSGTDEGVSDEQTDADGDVSESDLISAGGYMGGEEEAVEGFEGFVNKVMGIFYTMIDNGTIWYVVIGVALLIVVIMVLIIVIGMRRKKNEIQPVTMSNTGFSLDSRDGDMSQGKTRREDDGDSTVRESSTSASSNIFGTDEFGGGSGNTIHVDNEENGTMRIDPHADNSGTVRLDTLEEDDESGGTQRIEEIAHVDITMDEMRDGKSCDPRILSIDCDYEIVLGRSKTADVLIDDKTVSSKHMSITYDGLNVYIVDLGSTNGTKLNGSDVTPRQSIQINSGDSVLMGKTTLTFRF